MLDTANFRWTQLWILKILFGFSTQMDENLPSAQNLRTTTANVQLRITV